MATQAAPKTVRPPPLFIHDKGRWTEVSRMCNDRHINYLNARAVEQGIKISVASSGDYRELSKLLQFLGVRYHTHSLKETIPTRVVIKNIPTEISTQEILSDLESQKIPVAEVHRMHRKRGGSSSSAPFNMVLVVCDPVEGHHPIHQITKICGLSGIRIERPHKSGVMAQCHRCQLYGHAQRNCFGKPRCVKCLGDHGTAECPRPKDRTLCTEPPSCVLCGEAGHPANYRGCPKAPKSSAPKLTQRANLRQRREVPSFTENLSASQSPQRPNPWTGLNHRAQFTAHPQNIPPLMGKLVARPSLPTRPIIKAAEPTAPRPTLPTVPSAPRHPAPLAPWPPANAKRPPFTFAAPPPPPAASASALDPLDPFMVITSTYAVFHSPRGYQMSRDIIACNGDFVALAQIFNAYSDVTQALKKLPHNSPQSSSLRAN